MFEKKIVKVFVVALAFAPFCVYAAQKEKAKSEKISPWKGSQLQFGLLVNTGNTDNKTFNSQLNVNYGGKQWSNALELQAQYATARDAGKTQEFYYGENQLNYNFNPKKTRFMFFNGNVTKNYFSPYDLQYVLASGYGFTAIDKPSFSLSLQLGPGWRSDQITDSHKVQNRFIITSAAKASLKVSKLGSVVSEQLVYEVGKPFQSYDFVRSTTSLTNKIIDDLAVRVSYVVTHFSSLPPGNTNQFLTDTNTNISLIYSFV